MNIFVLLTFLKITIFLSCKSYQPYDDSMLAGSEAMRSNDARIVFPQPQNQVPTQARSVAQMVSLIPGVDGDIAGRPTAVSQTFDGENILWMNDEGEYYPILSIDQQNKVWIYETEIIILPGENDSSFQKIPTSMISKRLPSEHSIELVDSIPFRKFSSNDGLPKLAKITDNLHFADNTLFRVANDFFDEEQSVRFRFIERAPSIWQLEGGFQGSLLCNGSVLWRDSNGWHALTRRFEKLQYTKWTSSNDTLVFSSIGPTERVPNEFKAMVTPCPTDGHTDSSSWIDAIEYDPLAPPRQEPGRLFNFNWGDLYPLGTLIEYDDTTWRVLESRPALGFYRILNYGRVPREDQGRNMQRVYELRASSTNPHFDDFKPEFVELGTVENFIVAASESFDELNMERIRAQETSRKLQETAYNKMKVAETKANIVGADLSSEWYKPVIRIAGHAAADRMLDPNFAGGSAKLFGLTPSGASIQGAITTAGVPIRNRMAAFFTYTMVEATLNASAPVIVNLQRGTNEEALQAIQKSLTSTGIIHAMRGIAAATPTKTDDVIAFVASGFVMRWRKIRMEEAVGYENLHQLGNMAAGGIQAYMQIRAVNAKMRPGRVKAIGKAGVLVSEIISGRAYPGVIIGGLGEIATDIIVVHPLIRPFANTAAEQTSALVQIFDAMHAHSRHGNSLENQRQLRLSQGSLFNSIAYILKTQPQVLDQISFLNQETLVTVMSDPYRSIRQHYTGQ